MSTDNLPNDLPGGSAGSEQMDAANKSLADALHFSFRLLSGIMVLALVVLLMTGMARIKPQEAGLRLLFGRIQGTGEDRVFGEGLRFSWPEPAGRVERVSIKSEKLEIDDFWMDEKPGEMDKKLEDRQPSMEGLRPGYDGALLTGDRGLVHVKFTCWYSFKTGGPRAGGASPSAVVAFLSNIADPKEVIRSAVCNAAIYASATRTVEAIYSGSHAEYVEEIRELAQKHLDTFDSGITIRSILVERATVPIAAIAAFNAVTSARLEGDTAMNKARGRANTILRKAAGANWKKLVGDLEVPGLMDGYAIALQTNDRAEASKLLAEMDAAGLLDPYGEPRKRALAEAAGKLLAETDREALQEQAKLVGADLGKLKGSSGEPALAERYDAARKAGDQKLAAALLEAMDKAGLLALYADLQTRYRSEAAGTLLADIDRLGIRQFALQVEKAGHERTQQALEEEIERIGLLRLYARAREEENRQLPKEVLESKKALSAELLKEINEALLSHKTTGEAAGVIQAAVGYSAEIRELAKARGDSFLRTLRQFEADPELMVSRLWANVQQRVLTAPTNRKWYLTPGPKMILMISEPPEISKRIEELKLRKEKTKEAEEFMRRRR